MDLRTPALLLALALASTAPVGAGLPSPTQETGDLRVRWVSSPPGSLESNHHTPAAAYVEGEAFVAVPINSRQGTVCRLSMLDGEGEERWNHSIPAGPCTVHALSDPAIADFDSDGRPEVIAATSEKELVAYDLSTGERELRHDLTSFGYSRPVVANVTPAPGPETVVVDLAGGVFVLRPDGEEVWTRELGDARARQPAVRDFDADGAPELAVGQLRGAVVLLEDDGRVAWRVNVTDSVAVRWLAAGQLDGDGPIEVVASTFTGHVVALDGATGAVEWRATLGNRDPRTPHREHAATGDRHSHGTTGAAVRAIGDGDGDGQTEVYPVARDGRLYSLSGDDGSIEWQTALADGAVRVSPPPSMGDVDGDGRPELVAASFTGRVTTVDPSTGRTEATYERGLPIRTFPRLADLDGDGTPEVLVIYGDGSVIALSAERSGGTNRG